MTSSNDPWTISGMKEANAQLEEPVRDYLSALIDNPPEHARFLNMLAMLEHMGSRKIMVSQMNRQDTLDLETLKHLSEEARHAFFFKRQAERIAGHPMDGWSDENTTLRIPAQIYFGRLDAGISKQVPGDKAYGWVSLIIELRACWLYAIYQNVLERSDLHLSLKSLLAEEDMHLAEMFEMVGEDHAQIRALSAYETGLFGKFWAKLSAVYPVDKLAA